MVNVTNAPKAYSEVYEFINILGENYKREIPEKIYYNIKNNRDKSYTPVYNKNQSVDTDTFSKEALALIAALNLKYWCKDPKEKEILKNIYYENTQKEEKKLYENMFKSKALEEKEELVEENRQMIEYKEENIFEKILTSIKVFFKNIIHKK